jgi:hypothetical protein
MGGGSYTNQRNRKATEMVLSSYLTQKKKVTETTSMV